MMTRQRCFRYVHLREKTQLCSSYRCLRRASLEGKFLVHFKHGKLLATEFPSALGFLVSLQIDSCLVNSALEKKSLSHWRHGNMVTFLLVLLTLDTLLLLWSWAKESPFSDQRLWLLANPDSSRFRFTPDDSA